MKKNRRSEHVLLGDSIVRVPPPSGSLESVERDGEVFFRIANYHAMPPFLMSVISGQDHWLFVSSTGGLTCGRRAPENALFPYCTDDKIHDAAETTGPQTVLLADRNGERKLWQPFDRGPLVYDLERNLYKNVTGNKLVFEEINRDLGLLFSYAWTFGNRFGFVREVRLANLDTDEVRVDVLDGLRNLLPYGVDRTAQSELSTLVDAYKQSEAVEDVRAGIFTLSSILTDRAEPREALKATLVWSIGLEQACVLLSEDQVETFCLGNPVNSETSVRGKRCAFFVQSAMSLPANAERCWYLLADVEQGPSRTAGLLNEIRQGLPATSIARDVADGTARLRRLAGGADGFQKSADTLVTGRHFSNTLSNIMRGGVFPHGYEFPRTDFIEFLGRWHRPSVATVASALDSIDGPLTRESALKLAAERADPTLIRLVHEYLPLTFSRRHGDPSRPWNHFSIQLENADGSERLDYQGNWRDIFQNWEALALSYPGYIESFVGKFVNASTPDGYNPYRISSDGIDWEVLEPGVAWSNIGYWGDHQIVYLLRLLELSGDYQPGRIGNSLARDLYVYADVPYRIRPYREMLANPRNTVDYDDERASAVAARVAGLGADGRLVVLEDGSIYRVNLLEKLLLPSLVKIANLVPGGGIWMNTQRPEWNDANNALVGYGLSMVTLFYLRRYLHVLHDLLPGSDADRFEVSREVAQFFEDLGTVLRDHAGRLDDTSNAAGRKSFMDAMGAAADRYRARVYRGFCGRKTPLDVQDLQDFIALALQTLDHSIASNRRQDGLYHSYNLLRFGCDGYDVERLDEMLEGQVAALSCGHLDGPAAAQLLDALRRSRLYREDRNSYVLYPDRELPFFREKNVIPDSLIEDDDWIRRELASGRTAYVERDVDGKVHFNGCFTNAEELRATLKNDLAVESDAVARLCDLFETVFEHRRFTGRSGSMYKYEGLGCIYWHMVSKLLVATGETLTRAMADGEESSLVDRLRTHWREIRDGLGVHKSPAEYGAFPVDPYSHTPAFAGAQQPGLTGQVKEDLIARYWQLGVGVDRGEVVFEPVVLERTEFLEESTPWSFSVGGSELAEDLPAGSLAFTLCGVPVVYRLAKTPCLHVLAADGSSSSIPGARLGPDLSRSLFMRERRIRRLIVDIPEAALA